MKRLVYAPKVDAYIKSDYGTFDISEYITAGGVQRKLDQISTAELTIRNPNKKWTDHEYYDSISKEHEVGPIFHPMDPITIVLTRLENRPVQVFTGYLDKTPYLQMFPGTITLTASCTLKRLLYTFFDPGLPFFEEFLTQHGWEVVEGIGAVKPSAEGERAKQKGRLTDTGFGELLYATLHEIGGWSDNTIFIEEIPSGLIELVTNLFEKSSKEAKKSNEDIINLFHEIIGTASLGSGELSIDTNGQETHPVTGTLHGVSQAQALFCYEVAKLTGLSLRVLGAWCLAEGGPDYNPLNIGPGADFGSPQGAAKATSKTLHGSLYKGVLSSTNESDQKQIKAIVASPWNPGGGQSYEQLILSCYYERVSVS